MKTVIGLLILVFMAPNAMAAKKKVAQASRSETVTAPIAEALPPEARPVTFVTSIKTTFATLVEDNNYATGSRTNLTELKPSLQMKTRAAGEYGMELPIVWLRDQGESSSRIIGRPLVTAWIRLIQDADGESKLGFGVRPPLFDTSFGGAEFNRGWQFGPRLDHSRRIGQSRNLFLASANITYDTPVSTSSDRSTATTLDVSETKYERGTVAQGAVGLGREIEGGLLGATFNAKYGIGKPHATYKSQYYSSSGSYGYNSDTRLDLQQVELTWIDLFGQFNIGANTRLTTALHKMLKYEHSFAAYLNGYDDLPAISSLAASIGVAQSF